MISPGAGTRDPDVGHGVGNMPTPHRAGALGSALDSALDSALRGALDALQDVAANDSLCTLKGERVQAAKYWEGHVVALKELQRIRRGAPSSEARADGHAALLTQWSKQLSSHDRSDLKWRSYLVGGLDALNSVVE